MADFPPTGAQRRAVRRAKKQALRPLVIMVIVPVWIVLHLAHAPISAFVIAFFVISIGGGIALAIAQQVHDAHNK